MDERDSFSFTGIRKKLRLYKNFYKYYKYDFIPITIHEQSDKKKTLQRFDVSKLLVFTLTFLLSGKFRNFRIELKKLPEDTIAVSTLHRFCNAFFGYFICHIFALYLLFNHAEYVRLRLAYENKCNYKRENGIELFDEYPFRHKTDFLFSDLQVRNRITNMEQNQDQKIKKGYFKKKNSDLKEKEKD